MRDYRGNQSFDVSYFVLERLVGAIRADKPTLPRVLDQVKDLGAVHVLADREARSYFPSKPVPIAGLEGNAEATLAVDVS